MGAAQALPGPYFLILAGFEQGCQTTRLKLGGIPQLHPLRPMGKLLVIGTGQRSQPFQIGPPPLLDGFPLRGKLGVQHLEQGHFFGVGTFLPGRGAAQQSVFLLQGPQIAAVHGQVAGVELTEGGIQKFAPPLGRSLDQTQVAGVEHDSRKTAGKPCCPPGGCPVHRGVPPGPLGIRGAHRQPDTVRLVRLLFLLLCPECGGFQHGKRLTPPHQLCILAAPEALAAGQQPDGLQQVGLALAVVAADHGQLPARGQACRCDIAIIRYF